MPYKGKSVTVVEMLDILASNGRTEAGAALELERAIEDSRICLLLPDGTDGQGETLYCQMSPLGRSHVIAVLRALPERMRTPLIRLADVPLEMVKAARAIRMEFEAACDVPAAATPTEPQLTKHVRQVGDDALVEEALRGQENGLWPNMHQAAIGVCKGTDGIAPPSMVSRIERKISKLVKTNQNTSKH